MFVAILLALAVVCFSSPLEGVELANRPPTLTRLDDYRIRAGTSDHWTIEASDPDRDALSFRLVGGPAFVSVRTVRPGHGVAQGEILVVADSCARGTSECVVEVTDGSASDRDTFMVIMGPMEKAPAPSPVHASKGRSEAIDWSRASPIDPQWIIGEWEWHETIGGKIFSNRWGPAEKGCRRRLIFHRSGAMEMFEIGLDQVVESRGGTYKVSSGRGFTRLTVSAWIDRWMGHRIEGEESFAASNVGSSLCLYPWGVSDAGSEIFVRVPAITQEGSPADPELVLHPFDPPSVFDDGQRARLTLPGSMQAALRACDPSFHVWDDADSRDLHRRGRQGASGIIGDFDGDLLPDVALLGRSGADQVIIALLSAHGMIRATEVAWRKAFPGSGANRSRGDPRSVSPIYLEKGGRGTSNPFCWTPQKPLPLDAVGIVVAGAARYDYVYEEGQFVLFAPYAESSPNSRSGTPQIGR